MTYKKLAVVLAAAAVSAPALATNGYFSHGYGMKSIGMAGVGIALPQDALAAATNPAGMVLVGDRLDVGLDWFRPVRDAEIVDSFAFGGPGSSYKMDGSGKKNFFIPEFGYNKMMAPDWSLGVSVYGNGGMNTQYDKGVPLFGTGKAGVDLMQLFIAPTVAKKFALAGTTTSCGVSLNLAYQRFKAEGLQNFDNAMFSQSPGDVTNKGYDSSTGYGARFGCIVEITPIFSVGATYQTKTSMGKLNKYKGLFAEQGSFDIPENYGVGFSVKATPTVTLAADVEMINYSKIKSIGNPFSKFATNQLGSSDGPGFGWNDMKIIKMGAAWQVMPALTLRAGYSHGDQPIPASETLFNILAPGVVENHLTFGGTFTVSPTSEVTVAYMHAYQKTVYGVNSIPMSFGGGNANLKMYEDSLGVAYGIKF